MIIVIEAMQEIQGRIHTIGAKILMGISAPNMAYQLNEYLPDVLADPIIWALTSIYSIEWVELLSTLAIVMLIVERFYATKLSIAKRKQLEK
tara:strand:+ start:149 stop:424 length:276 start_codon:yes stop_codon:yes gene_type:complete